MVHMVQQKLLYMPAIFYVLRIHMSNVLRQHQLACSKLAEPTLHFSLPCIDVVSQQHWHT